MASNRNSRLGIVLIYNKMNPVQASFAFNFFNEFHKFRTISGYNEKSLPLFFLNYSIPHWRRYCHHYFPAISQTLLPTVMLIHVKGKKPGSYIKAISSASDPYKAVTKIFRKLRSVTSNPQVIINLFSKLNISTNTVGAEVYLDGKNLGESPISADVEPGIHRVIIVARHYETFVNQVSVKFRKIEFLKVTLQKFIAPINVYIYGTSSVYQQNFYLNYGGNTYGGGTHFVPFPSQKIINDLENKIKQWNSVVLTSNLQAPYKLHMTCNANDQTATCHLIFIVNEKIMVGGKDGVPMPNVNEYSSDTQGAMVQAALQLFNAFAPSMQRTILSSFHAVSTGATLKVKPLPASLDRKN